MCLLASAESYTIHHIRTSVTRLETDQDFKSLSPGPDMFTTSPPVDDTILPAVEKAGCSWSTKRIGKEVINFTCYVNSPRI